MILTKFGKELMGFTEYPETDSIEIHFGIIKAYSLRGMMFEKDCEIKQSEVVSFGHNCAVTLSQSINEACKLLTGNVFADDEEKWLSDKKAIPPFALIYFREKMPRVMRGGYRQEKDGYIYTYDAIPEGKIDIKNWENESLPNIVTALTVHLSTLERQVDLVPVERSVFGTTKEGKTLFDLKLTGSASAHVSSPQSLEEINSSLERSEKLFSGLTDKVRL